MTSQPEFSIYLPALLLRRLAEFKAQQGISENSAAVVAILEAYFGTASFEQGDALQRLEMLEGKWFA